jgi:hypothetical protein
LKGWGDQVEVIIRIEFEGDGGFWFDLFGQGEVGPGTSVDLDGGTRLTYENAHIEKGIDAANWIEIALAIPIAVDATANIAQRISAWLVNHGPQRDKVTRLEIHRRTVEFEEDKITRVIEETIRELPGDAR